MLGGVSIGRPEDENRLSSNTWRNEQHIESDGGWKEEVGVGVGSRASCRRTATVSRLKQINSSLVCGADHRRGGTWLLDSGFELSRQLMWAGTRPLWSDGIS